MNNDTPAKGPKKQNILLRLLTLAVTAALVLGALTLVVYRDRFNLDALKRWMAFRALETSDTGEVAPFTHAGGDKLAVAYLNGGVLLSSSSGVHYYSLSGETYAEQVLAMKNPVLSASTKAGVVYDAGGGSLFLFQGAQQTMHLSPEEGGALLSARVNDSGWLTVTAQQSGYKGAVTVYDGSGERVIQISLSSTFVVDAVLSPDCKTVAVVTMDQDRGAFESKVSFYPVDSKQPRLTASLGNSTVLDLDYEDDTLWVLGETQLTMVAQDDGSLHSYPFERNFLKGCTFGADGFALLLLGRYRAGAATQALTVSGDGTVLGSVPLSGQVLSYAGAGGYASLLTGGGLTIYTSDLQPYSHLESTQGARYTDLSANGSALLANAQQAWLYIPK